MKTVDKEKEMNDFNWKLIQQEKILGICNKHLQREIVCVGVSFSKEKRGINGYKDSKIPSNRIL